MALYYRIGYGLGNILQTTPAYRFLKSLDSEVILCTQPQYLDTVRAVYGDVPVLSVNRAGNYFRSAIPHEFEPNGYVSEVIRNLQMVGYQIPSAEDRRGFCEYEDPGETFDLLICNGYKKTPETAHVWKVKSYPGWAQVAEAFRGRARVASIGHTEEYVPGTIDRTGIGLRRTFGLIRRAGLLASNDTGFYHAAAALGTPTLVVFTMTDPHKNHDAEFHRTARILTRGLACQSCQLEAPMVWMDRKATCEWACREIEPSRVVREIEAML